MGRALAHHGGIGEHRERLPARIRHRIGDREHVVVVDRELALEGDALRVRPGQRQRGRGRQRLPARLPDRFGVGHVAFGSSAREQAEIGEEGIRGMRWREQHDLRAARIWRFAIGRQRQVVDAGALERDGAGQMRVADLNARRGLERILARELLGRIRRGRAGGARGRGQGRRCVGLCGVFPRLGWSLDLNGLVGHEVGRNQILPPNEHQERQSDRREKIALIVHSELSRAGRAYPGLYGETFELAHQR